jgi:ABC-type transporter Mla subunit MlaD
MVDEKPLPHQLHDLAHQLMDEIDRADEHLEHAHDALLDFVHRVGDREPAWVDLLLQKAGKLQAAAQILAATAEEVHDPASFELPSFGDEPGVARA